MFRRSLASANMSKAALRDRGWCFGLFRTQLSAGLSALHRTIAAAGEAKSEGISGDFAFGIRPSSTCGDSVAVAAITSAGRYNTRELRAFLAWRRGT